MDENTAIETHGSGPLAVWPGGRYVVGVDGSEASIEALAYAIRLANCSHATVKVVFAWQSPLIYHATWTSEWDPSMTAGKVLADAVDAAAKGVDVRPPISFVFREGSASAILRELSNDADLLVVGSRGNGGFAGLLLGSVSSACAEHAKCPVLIVRSFSARQSPGSVATRTSAALPAGRYIVGIDGSKDSSNVLPHAIRLAATTHSLLHVVTAWNDPVTFEPIVIPVSWSPEGNAQGIATDTIESVFGEDVPDWVTAAAVPGYPAETLIRESETADLLIVGSRGHGGFAGLLLGSVSAACTEYASCPVLVVHGTRAVLPDPAEREGLDL